MADLVRSLTIEFEVDFIKIDSYGDKTKSSGTELAGYAVFLGVRKIRMWKSASRTAAGFRKCWKIPNLYILEIRSFRVSYFYSGENISRGEFHFHFPTRRNTLAG